jgi:hypothetical protein
MTDTITSRKGGARVTGSFGDGGGRLHYRLPIPRPCLLRLPNLTAAILSLNRRRLPSRMSPMHTAGTILGEAE